MYLRESILKSKLSVHEFAFVVDKFYDWGSDKDIHKRETPDEPKTSEEWEVLFRILGARHDFEKKAVKILFVKFPSVQPPKCKE